MSEKRKRVHKQKQCPYCEHHIAKRLCVDDNDADQQRITDLENELKNAKEEIELTNNKLEIALKESVLVKNQMNTKLAKTEAKYENELKLKKKLEIEKQKLQKYKVKLSKSDGKLTQMTKQLENRDNQNKKL
eukprot:Pgem_evm1s11174